MQGLTAEELERRAYANGDVITSNMLTKLFNYKEDEHQYEIEDLTQTIDDQYSAILEYKREIQELEDELAYSEGKIVELREQISQLEQDKYK